MNMEKVHKKLIKGLRDYFQKYDLRKAVVGLSGGIDSALTFKLAVDALGSANVFALILPELGITKDENIKHAKALTDFFKVKSYYQPINALSVDFNIAPWKPNRLAQMNTKARIRAALLYSFANSNNALVLGTSNKSEILLGYGTKYGDLAADIEVLGNLYKTEVYALAEYLHLPDEIIQKMPTAELEEGQTDENDLGANYRALDGILQMLEEKTRMPIIVKAGYPEAMVKKVQKMITKNQHKREMPPVLEV
ncbi:NAD+ synthase [Candidatus Peregrinibacteria bacterium]|jgi:NAD+ synthase|nr:NAD+ synthase [Candidatus Peregrinibacteria bacterium]MBT7484489.1 NAD+ synthase [Candidatus Peregrinibacteria bacterium]